MSNFISNVENTQNNTQESSSIIVNLDNVNSILLDYPKTIFNFNYPITLVDRKHNSTEATDKLISDYVYFWHPSDEKIEEIKSKTLDWINFRFSDNPTRYANPKNIAFFKFEDNKRRIIGNFSSPVSLDENRLTSDAIYWDFENHIDYEEAKAYIESL